jgi:membrane protein DedA with SNARE-associated domain
MTDMTDLFLNGMVTYGPLILGLALLLGAAGLPLPTGLLVLAAGAFARQGLMEWTSAGLVALVGVVLGDLVSYCLGRFGGDLVQRTLRGRRALWDQALARFRRYGAMAIYSTRVVLTSLDVPTNLVAGSSGYTLRRFLIFGVAGRLTWLALYGGLGYVFGRQWPVVSQAIGQYGLWLGVAAALGAGPYVLLRHGASATPPDIPGSHQLCSTAPWTKTPS